MDIQLLGYTLKIKSKKTTLAIDPKTTTQKFDADAVLLIDKDDDVSRVSNYRIIIDGPGEYEISGFKISGVRNEEGVIYSFQSENINALVTKASFLKSMNLDRIGEHEVVIINTDSQIDESRITAMESRLVILYGEKAKEVAKSLGKEGAEVLSKVSISSEKLPEETNVILLG